MHEHYQNVLEVQWASVVMLCQNRIRRQNDHENQSPRKISKKDILLLLLSLVLSVNKEREKSINIRLVEKFVHHNAYFIWERSYRYC